MERFEKFIGNKRKRTDEQNQRDGDDKEGKVKGKGKEVNREEISDVTQHSNQFQADQVERVFNPTAPGLGWDDNPFIIYDDDTGISPRTSLRRPDRQGSYEEDDRPPSRQSYQEFRSWNSFLRSQEETAYDVKDYVNDTSGGNMGTAYAESSQASLQKKADWAKFLRDNGQLGGPSDQANQHSLGQSTLGGDEAINPYADNLRGTSRNQDLSDLPHSLDQLTLGRDEAINPYTDNLRGALSDSQQIAQYIAEAHKNLQEEMKAVIQQAQDESTRYALSSSREICEMDNLGAEQEKFSVVKRSKAPMNPGDALRYQKAKKEAMAKEEAAQRKHARHELKKNDRIEAHYPKPDDPLILDREKVKTHYDTLARELRAQHRVRSQDLWMYSEADKQVYQKAFDEYLKRALEPILDERRIAMSDPSRWVQEQEQKNTATATNDQKKHKRGKGR